MSTIKRPDPIRIGDLYANVERGPDKHDPNRWYWRIREKGGQKVFIGWTTEAHVREMMTNAAGAAANSAPAEVVEEKATEPVIDVQTSEPSQRVLTVGIVSKIEHAQTLTNVLSSKGHVAYYMPHVTKVTESKVDVLVCRHKSGSHAMFDACTALAREGTLPVIFENGITQTMEQIEQIVAGTFVQTIPRYMQEQMTVRPPPLPEPTENRREKVDSVKLAIGDFLEKAGFFANVMLKIKPEAVRDILASVPHDSKERVRRVATFRDMLALQKLKLSLVEEACTSLASEDRYYPATFWASDGKQKWTETLLCWEACTQPQLSHLVDRLGRRVDGVSFSTHEPEIVPEVGHESTESEPSPPIEVAQVKSEAVPEVKLEVVSSPVIRLPLPSAPMVTDAAVPQDIVDLLVLLQAEMDKFGVTRLPSSLMEKVGFTDTGGFDLSTVTVHAKTHGSAMSMCGTPSLRSAAVMSHVTCKKCKATEFYQMAEAYQNMLLAEISAANK